MVTDWKEESWAAGKAIAIRIPSKEREASPKGKSVIVGENDWLSYQRRSTALTTKVSLWVLLRGAFLS